MKRILSVCLLLCLFMSAAAAENMVGYWGFSGGAEVHGDGFFLAADGRGEWLEALNYEYFPLSEFLRTGDTFTWETVQEGDKQYLLETYPDGLERKWEIQRFDDSGEIHIPEGDSGGFYYPINSLSLVVANDPLDVIPELVADNGKFRKDKMYDVYQGPGEEYGRSGAGKGKVSTNGTIWCYGTWKGWLLIEYEINAKKYRYGWINTDELPQSQAENYKTLKFLQQDEGYVCGVLIQDAKLTDDPFYSKNVTADMDAGTSVHVLAKKQEYLLVEGFVGRQKCMGFVHESYVDTKYGYAENTAYVIDEAKTYSQEDILAAMWAVEDFVRSRFSGTGVLEIKYVEAESADADDWWQPETENREGMQLYADLSSMSLYDGEIAGYGVARDYGFILYRDKDGAWEVGNWGYE